MLLLHLTPDCAASLAPHRMRQGWEVCEEVRGLWLRCPENEGTMEATAALPCLQRYRLDAAGGLIPFHATLPVADPPAGPWLPVPDYLMVLPLPPQLPGRIRPELAFSLQRSSHEVPAAALLVSVAALTAWADHTSRLRLARLTFAAASDGRALVTGTPLPPLPGQACWTAGRLVLPCGWEVAPPLRAAWVQQAIAPAPGALVLIHPDARVEILRQEAFAPLTLAALRLTMAPPASSRIG